MIFIQIEDSKNIKVLFSANSFQYCSSPLEHLWSALGSRLRWKDEEKGFYPNRGQLNMELPWVKVKRTNEMIFIPIEDSKNIKIC